MRRDGRATQHRVALLTLTLTTSCRRRGAQTTSAAAREMRRWHNKMTGARGAVLRGGCTFLPSVPRERDGESEE